MHIFILCAMFSKNKKWNDKNTADVLDKQLCKDALRACPGAEPLRCISFKNEIAKIFYGIIWCDVDILFLEKY